MPPHCLESGILGGERMKLLTKELMRQIPMIHSTNDVSLEDKIIVAKFFTPDSNWTWFVVEGETYVDGTTDEWDASDPPERKAISLSDALLDGYGPDNLDILFFGVVRGFELEWGYFALEELQSVRGPLGLAIERDLYWTPKKWSEIPDWEKGLK